MKRSRILSRGEHGFSLIELLVALAISAVIMGVLFKSLFDIQRSWDTSRDQVDNVRNERAGVEMMIRDIRMAGSGYGGVPVTIGGLASTTLFPLQPLPGALGDPDTLVVTASFSGVSSTTTATVGAPIDPIVVADGTGFDKDDLVVITNGQEANLFYVTAVSGGGTTLHHNSVMPLNDPVDHATNWPAGGYAPSSIVTEVNIVSYWIDDSVDPPRLLRQSDMGPVLPVSTSAFHLKVDYVLADGTVSANPADPSLIRSALLRYVPPHIRGPNEVYTGYSTAGDTLQVRIQPRVMG